MSQTDLVALNRGRKIVGIVKKKDLVDYLIKEGFIDLIPAPEPVEYRMSEVKAMQISALKKAMEEAGVFFHAKDVVEKSDLISVFVNSGRLSIVPADDEPDEDQGDCGKGIEEHQTPLKRTLAETVEEGSDDKNDTADRCGNGEGSQGASWRYERSF